MSHVTAVSSGLNLMLSVLPLFTVPQTSPQRSENQALHARYALHACIFLLSNFVSIEYKGTKILIPKLDVAGSIPVARSILLRNSCVAIFKSYRNFGNLAQILLCVNVSLQD